MRRLTAAVFMLCILTSGCRRERDVRPDIFLVIIDTLRADHLGCYGYDRDTSPVIDSLAASGMTFSHFQANSPWTLPSHASIWTGLSVQSHAAGMRNRVYYGINPDLSTIATILDDHGYMTLGFVNTRLLRSTFGFSRGFDYYKMNPSGHGMAGRTVDNVVAWFADNIGNPYPKLVVIHLFDPHAPYDPPDGFDRMFSDEGFNGIDGWVVDSLNTLTNPQDLDYLLDMYDGEIAWVDHQLGRLFNELDALGCMDNALVIITSDHGEEFLDHGDISHGHNLYQELLHVPLVISGPGVPAGIINSTPGGHFDILPTVTAYAGIVNEEGVEGIDLLTSEQQDRPIPSSGAIWARSLTSEDNASYESLCSVMLYPMIGIRNYLTLEEAAYDLSVDPAQLNRMDPDPGMLEELDYYWATPPRCIPIPIQPADSLVRNLQDLGYIR